MFILLGYLSIALVQLYRQYRRRTHYASTMLRALRNGSVLVQRGKCVQRSSAGALLNSSLLSCSQSYKESQLLSDEHLAVAVVSPKQRVDLGEWTSYLDLHPAQEDSHSVIVLLEARRPSNIDAFQTSAKNIPLAYQVHVLKHGCPIAWRSGSPFGIILHCSYRDFILLCDAFGQGRLIVDEDLELCHLMTVSTVGKPRTLKQIESEEAAVATIKNDLDAKRAIREKAAVATAKNDLEAKQAIREDAAVGTAKNDLDAKRAIREDAAVATAKNDLDAKQDIREKATVATAKNDLDTKQPIREEATVATAKNDRDAKWAIREESTAAAAKQNLQANQTSKETAPGLVSAESDSSARAMARDGSRDLASGMISTKRQGQEAPAAERPPKGAGARQLNQSEGQICAGNGVADQPFSASVNGSESSMGGQDSESVCRAPNGTGSVRLNQNTSEKIADSGNASQIAGNRAKFTDSDSPVAIATGAQQGLKTLSESMESGKKAAKVHSATESPDSLLSKNGGGETLKLVSTPAGSPSNSTNGTEFPGISANSTESPGNSAKSPGNSANSAKYGNSASSTESPGNSASGAKSPINSASSTKSPINSANSAKSGSSASGTESPGNSANGTSNVGSASQGNRGGKPPNVVVYCGQKDSARKFDLVRTGLEQCLNVEAYTIYILPHDEVMSVPWEDNSAALIISHDYLHDNIRRKCADFLAKGGKVISFGSSMEAEFVVRKEVHGQQTVAKFSLDKWQDVLAIQGRYRYVPDGVRKDGSKVEVLVVDSKSGDPLVVKLMLSADGGSGGRAIFSQLLLERDPGEMAVDSKTFSRLKQSNAMRLEVLRHLLSLLELDTSLAPSHTLTPCYLLAEDQMLKTSLLDALAGRMKQGSIKARNLTLRFVSAKSGSAALIATTNCLPVITDQTPGASQGMGDARNVQFFDPQLYWHHLTSSVLGHVVFYADVIPTTMTVFEGIQFSIPDKVGVIAVAGRQTSGKGRGGNAWLSPVGCAMFTLPLHLPVDSALGQRVSFLQHIIALAVVHSVRSMPGYKELDLRLKWPNDIYFGDKMKLGGVLVTSTIMDKTVHATVGCGVNVSNSQPTICINDVIHQHNCERGLNLKPLTTSELLARTVSAIEDCVTQFQDKGHEDFCQLYYKYWLHSGACVKVESEGNAEVQVCGLDDFGFLRVVNRQGEQLSVQPDGNSFDMLRNLITVKRD